MDGGLMKKIIASMAAALIALKLMKPKAGTASKETLESLYIKHGINKGVDWKLLKAIATVESSENPNAKNPLDPSVGLMQILCVPDGTGGCKNRFNILDWPPISEQHLYDPDVSLHYASQN